MAVPLLDLKRQYIKIKDRVDKAVQEVFDKGYFILGPPVADLEKRGIKAIHRPTTELLLDEILHQGRPGDLLLIMSNGAFDNLPSRILDRLRSL